MSAGTPGPPTGLRLGIETYGQLVTHTDDEGAGHALVTGGTGAGKTIGVLTMMRDAIAMGRCVIYVDIKGGPDVAAHLAELAARHGRVFRHWSFHDPRAPYRGPADAPAFYDPIGRGDASRRKDLLVGSQKWDVEYYKTVVENYIQTALTVSDIVPPPPGEGSFQELATLLNPAALKNRALSLPIGPAYEELQQRVRACTEGMDDQEKSGIRGMASKLLILTGSVAGAWLRQDPTRKHDIDLGRAAREGEVVVFTLDSSNYESLSGQVAGLIVQDLKTLSSELRYDETHRRNGKPVHIVLDEFSAAGSVNVLGLLNKARDANMRVMVATQALADLVREEPQFAEQVMGIVGSFIIFRANYHADAEVYAGLTGAVRKDEVRMGIEMNTGLTGAMTEGAASGTGMITKVDGFRVEAREFQDLERGVAVYVATTPKRRVVFPVKVIREGAVVTEASPEGTGRIATGIASVTHAVGALTNRFGRQDTGPMAAILDTNHASDAPRAGFGTPTPVERWDQPTAPRRAPAVNWTGLPGEPETVTATGADRALPEDARALSAVHYADTADDNSSPSVFGTPDVTDKGWANTWGAEDTAGLEIPAIPIVDRQPVQPVNLPNQPNRQEPKPAGEHNEPPSNPSGRPNRDRPGRPSGSTAPTDVPITNTGDSAFDADEWKRT